MQLNQYIEKFRHSRNGKVLFENFAYLTILQVASYIFPFITLPYLARVVGTEGFGEIAFASAIMIWVQTIVDWGFNHSATRDVAANRSNHNKVSQTFSVVLWARMFLMLLSLLVLIILILTVPSFNNSKVCILVTFIMIPGHILFPDWFFQALERMKYISILNVVIKLFNTIAVFIFIKKQSDYILQPLFFSLGFLISGIVSMYIITVRWKYKIYPPDMKAVFRCINESKELFINTLMPNFYNSLTVVLLGIYSTSHINGIYDAGKKLVTIANNFLQILSRVFFPYLIRNPQGHMSYAKASLLVGFSVSALLFLLANPIINIFFGAEFKDSILILRITSFAIFFVTLSDVYGKNYLIVHKKDKQLMYASVTASVIGFMISFPLVYYYKAVGASITYLVSSMLLGTITLFYAKKESSRS